MINGMAAGVQRRPVFRWWGVVILLSMGLAACGSIRERDRGPAEPPVDIEDIGDAVPRDESRSRYGNPSSYEVFGKRYYVMDSAEGYVERGIASWYGEKFHGRYTSNREVYDMYAMTAAHKSMPLPTYVEVTNLENGHRVVVRVNDRGPFHSNRLIDLSYTAAAKLGILRKGTGLVEVRAVGYAPEPVPAPASTPVIQAGGQPAHNPGLYVQVGAFQNRDNAARLKTRLHSFSPVPVLISDGGAVQDQLHRVRLGPLADVSAADDLVALLERRGIIEARVIVE